MANWPINIVVLNSAGDMAYGASVQHASSGDTITWSSTTGAFTITFQGNSPLNEGLQLHSSPGTSGNTVSGQVKTGASPGVYYYSVAAMYSGQIYTDPGCPEIVVL
jgi:plastocyanin